MATKRSADALENDTTGCTKSGGGNPRPRKKLRNFTDSDRQLARIWENLANDEGRVRLHAAVELVRYCGQLSDARNCGNGSGDGYEEAATERDGEKVKGEEEEEEEEDEERKVTIEKAKVAEEGLMKIYLRLVRGLCSSRKSARIGFSLALTEVLRVDLSASSAISKGTKLAFGERVNGFLQFVEANTQTEGSMSGQEKRDHLIGRVFAYSSLIHSEVLFQVGGEKGGEDKDKGSLASVLNAVCKLSRQVSYPWLREECDLVCYQAVCMICASRPSSAVLESVLTSFETNGFIKTPTGVAIWLEIVASVPEFTSLPKGIWHKNDPLAGKEVATLAKILHSANAEKETAVSGSRQESPHFAWGVVLETLMRREESMDGKNTKKKTEYRAFKHFWNEAVDNLFYAPTASPEKKAIGFQVFASILSKAKPPALASTFSPKLLKCIINQSSQPDRYLHFAAKKLLDVIIARAQQDGDAAIVLFEALVSGNGTLTFDKMTKSKTVYTIFSSAEPQAAGAMIGKYRALVLQPGTEKEQVAETIRQTIADQLVGYARAKASLKTDKNGKVPTWFTPLMDFFIPFGYPQPGTSKAPTCSPPLSTKSQEIFRTRLLSCLTTLYDGRSFTEFEILPFLIKAISQYDVADFATLAQADEKICKTIERAKESVKSEILSQSLSAEGLSPPPNERGDQDRAFTMLVIMALLQAYSGEADAIKMLDELHECHEHMYSKKTKRHEQAYNTVVEIILSFCSQNSALNRMLAEQVFAAFTTLVTKEGLGSILEVLEQKEGLSGQQALFEQGVEVGEDDEVVGDGDDEDVEEVSADGSELSSIENAGSGSEDDVEVEYGESDDDVEVIEDEGQGEGSASGSNSISNDDDSSSSEDEDDDNELADFEKKLATALNVTRVATVPNADTSDTSSESSMDDDQMLSLDSTISSMFAHLRPTLSTTGAQPRASSKKDTARAAKENIVAFKTRALALLGIFLKKEFKRGESLEVVLPVLRCVRLTRSALVAKKAGSVLLDGYFPVAKKRGMPVSPPAEDDDDEKKREVAEKEKDRVWELLQEAFEEMMTFASKEHARVGSRCCLFLARCGFAVLPTVQEKDGFRKKIVKMYVRARKERKGSELLEWQERVWREWEEFERLTKG